MGWIGRGFLVALGIFLFLFLAFIIGSCFVGLSLGL